MFNFNATYANINSLQFYDHIEILIRGEKLLEY